MVMPSVSNNATLDPIEVALKAKQLKEQGQQDEGAFTLAFLLLAAMFYPSCRVLAEWQDEDTRKHLKENPKTMSEHYY